MPASGAGSPSAPTRASVVRNSLGVSVATGAYGVSFGAVGVAAGLSVAQTCALSLLLFSGASQFALAGVVASGGAPLAGALSAILLGTRNTLYGIRLSSLLDVRGWRRLATAHVVIDESTAMAVGQPDRDLARVGFYTTGVGIYVLWNTATAVGALVGDTSATPARTAWTLLCRRRSSRCFGPVWPSRPPGWRRCWRRCWRWVRCR